jgi:hypothetical protein
MKRKKAYGTVILGKDRGKYRFSNPNTKKGKADKAKTLAKLGLSPEDNWKQPKYFMIDGIPHKMDKYGNKVPLTLVTPAA